MACPRARFILVLTQMSSQGERFEKLVNLFDELYPTERAVHEAEIQITKMNREVERRVAERTGPAIDGHTIAVIRSIREDEQ